MNPVKSWGFFQIPSVDLAYQYLIWNFWIYVPKFNSPIILIFIFNHDFLFLYFKIEIFQDHKEIDDFASFFYSLSLLKSHLLYIFLL